MIIYQIKQLQRIFPSNSIKKNQIRNKSKKANRAYNPLSDRITANSPERHTLDALMRQSVTEQQAIEISWLKEMKTECGNLNQFKKAEIHTKSFSEDFISILIKY